MTDFGERFEKRRRSDEVQFSNAFHTIADALNTVGGTDYFTDSFSQITGAMSEVLRYYRLKVTDEGDENQSISERLERALRSEGIMYRSIRLKKDFNKTAVSPMIAVRRADKHVIALIPASFGGYYYTDEDGKKHRINRKTADQFEDEAYTFYKPFPSKELKTKDILCYAIGILNFGDLFAVLCSFLFAALIGLFIPRITKILFSEVIMTGSIRLLVSLGLLALCVCISGSLISVIKQICMNRLNTKISSSLEAATMIRLLSLPVSFFKKYNSGDLNSRLLQLSSLANMLVSVLLSAGLTVIFSVVYIVQMFSFSKGLSFIAVVVLCVQIILSLWTMLAEKRQSVRNMEATAKENGLAFTILSGIEKIRLAGAEKRMFALWSNAFAHRIRVRYRPPFLVSALPVISATISVFGTVFLYRTAVHSEISIADFYAFNSSFSMVAASFLMLGSGLKGVADLNAVIGNMAPIFSTVPENDGKKPLPETLNGNVELNHVSFSYDESTSPVISDFSLKIEKGQYVAIVGKSGCGKSTLIRLLLGFEKPDHGAIYYDGHNIDSMDMRFVRRQIGLVLQDSRLLHESIFDNIALSNPGLTMKEAWHAAEMADIAEDIRKMPMQMNTMIGEGLSGVSGGQKQRLLITRAIAGAPKLLIFDEATSALDNIAQEKVSDMLAQFNCTRIVVAHRLSTIRLCDRIVVMENGRIAEDGTYDELINRHGLFSELMACQRLDK